MRKLIIHIGHPKTGSTSLQHALVASRDGLEKLGILYPRAPRSHQHVEMVPHFFGADAAHFFMKRRHEQDPSLILAEADEIWSAMLADIERVDPHTIIFSAEILFGLGAHPQLARFLAEMRKLADEIEVVAYLRAPEKSYLSVRQQFVTFRGIIDLPAEQSYFRDALQPYLDHPDVKVHAHKFDRQSLIEGDIITDFFERHLPAEAKKALIRPPHDSNISLSAEAIALFEDFHRNQIPAKLQAFAPISFKLTKQIKQGDAAVPGAGRLTFLPGVALSIHNKAKDLDWVSDTFGVSFDPPPAGSAVDPPVNYESNSIRDMIFVDQDRYTALVNALDVQQPEEPQKKKFAKKQAKQLRIGKPLRQANRNIKRNLRRVWRWAKQLRP